MSGVATAFFQDVDFITAAYIVAFSMFIIGLSKLTSPTTAYRQQIDAFGMLIAVVRRSEPGVDGRSLLSRSAWRSAQRSASRGTHVKMTRCRRWSRCSTGGGGA